jgi:hypothetical protein
VQQQQQQRDSNSAECPGLADATGEGPLVIAANSCHKDENTDIALTGNVINVSIHLGTQVSKA